MKTEQVSNKLQKKERERTKLLSALKLTDSSEMEGGSTNSLFRS